MASDKVSAGKTIQTGGALWAWLGCQAGFATKKPVLWAKTQHAAPPRAKRKTAKQVLQILSLSLSFKLGRMRNLPFHQPIMQLTHAIAIHMSAALTALALGPFAIWMRLKTPPSPKLHRAFGYAWVTLMIFSVVSSLFIRDFRLPNIAGFSPIHLLVPYTLISLVLGFRALAQGRHDTHRKYMQSIYWGACVGAGLFTLVPGRYLGQLVWGQWLGWL